MASSLELRGDSTDLWAAQKDNIQELIQRGFRNNEVIADLRSRGFQTSLSPLKSHLQEWGIRRPAGATGVRIGGISDELAEAVNFIFHHTTLNDAQIAARIATDYELHTTARQVRSIRSRFGWLRASSGVKKAVQTAETRLQVENAIVNGPARVFGRRWLIAWLRLHGFKAY